MRRKNISLEKENEQFRILGNKLKDYKSKGKNCLAFISTQKGQGETYIIQKIAEILASSGQKTLILDCDFLENTLTKHNKLDHEDGLSELIQYIQPNQKTTFLDTVASEATFSYGKTLFKKLGPNLDILPSGRMGTLKQQITLPEEELGEVFEMFRENFDYILVAMPSFDYLSYTQILTRLVDGAVLVIKPGTINKASASEISKKIESLGCDILSSVLTKTEKTF